MVDGRIRELPRLGARQLRHLDRSIEKARAVAPMFGTERATREQVAVLLRHHQVMNMKAELPRKCAAILGPVTFGARILLIGRHVPRAARRLVLLHEIGHLFQGTADLALKRDQTAWQTAPELAADAFAAVGLVATPMVDSLLEAVIWTREIEDRLATLLVPASGWLWNQRRATAAARNRILFREYGGI